MRVLHVPFGYYPDPVGGTEVYVAQLARALRTHGVESAVAAPTTARSGGRYEHDGTAVHRFLTSAVLGVEAIYGGHDEVAVAALDALIAELAPDVVHLHAFTAAASLAAVRAAKARGAAVVFTYHTPTVSCVRGTLLRNGRTVCDGALNATRCAACLLDSRGMPAVARELVGRLPLGVGRAAARAGATGRWATALRTRELTTARHESLRALIREADAIVAVCDWVRSLLLGAGARPERLRLVRQGTTAPRAAPDPARPDPPLPGAPKPAATRPLRLAFLGRLDAVKGAHVVLEALAARRTLPVTLDIFGIVQDERSDAYRAQLERLAAGDPRVTFNSAVPAADVAATLGRFDALVVPSQWLETGPLVVLEAFAAGLPVIGSRLGGIAELVRDRADGLLVQHDDPAAWGDALARLATTPSLIATLRRGVRPPRTVVHVAADMATVYREVLPLGAGGGSAGGEAGGAVPALSTAGGAT